MIDTVRLRIPLTSDIYMLMLKKAKMFSKKDENTGFFDYVYYKNEMKLDSFQRNVNIKLPLKEIFYSSRKYQFVIIELSLPKYLYGHNAWLLFPSQLSFVLNKLYQEFKNYFDDFTHFEYWRIKRIDLCYNWQFPDEITALHIINLARPLKYPQKRLQQYPTGVTNIGRYHNIKFYLKHPEFKTHDYPELKKKGLDTFANEVFELSKGIVRFEVKFEEEIYETHFGKRFLYYQDVSDDTKIEKILQNHINTLLKFADHTAMSNQSAKEKLEDIFDMNRAGDLYSMWKLIYSIDPAEQEILKRNYSRWKVYRAKKDLQCAGVGIPNDEVSIIFDFAIPSQLVVKGGSACCLAPASSAAPLISGK